MAESFPAELSRVRRLSESTMDFRFRRTDGKPVAFTPGEFFRFSFADSIGAFARPYSLCNITDASEDEMDLVDLFHLLLVLSVSVGLVLVE